MVDSSTVQDSPKKATKPPPCRGPYHCHVASGNASSICAAKCFKCSSSSSANPGQTPEGFLSRTKMANSHQQMTPPRKVFFKMCFIEKRVTNSQAWDIFWGVPWKPKGYPKIQSSKPDQRDISPCHPPQILSFRCCHDHCFQNLTSGSFRWLLAKREGSSPCLFESLVNLWEIHKSFVMAGKIRFKSPYK